MGASAVPGDGAGGGAVVPQDGIRAGRRSTVRATAPGPACRLLEQDVVSVRELPMAPTAHTIVISPHFDDAVLGCGDLIAATPGCTVLTVFSGVPSADLPAPDWDRRCGYARADEAMLAREREDSLALAELDAQALRLGLLDSQYTAPPGEAEMAALRDALAGALGLLQPRQVYLPMGLFHLDHVRVSDAGLHVGALSATSSLCQWFAYEEALYRRKPGLLQRRLVELLARGVQATPDPAAAPAGARKARAVACYASQLAALGQTAGQGDPGQPERYWRLRWDEGGA